MILCISRRTALGGLDPGLFNTLLIIDLFILLASGDILFRFFGFASYTNLSMQEILLLLLLVKRFRCHGLISQAPTKMLHPNVTV